MQFRKHISLILTFIMVLSLPVPALNVFAFANAEVPDTSLMGTAPAESYFNTKVEAPETAEVGETFNVTVTIENTSDLSLGVVNFVLYYDNTDVEPVLSGTSFAGNVSGAWGNSDAILTSYGYENGVNGFAMVVEEVDAAKKGDTVVFTIPFKVLDTASGLMNFQLANGEDLWANIVMDIDMVQYFGTGSNTAVKLPEDAPVDPSVPTDPSDDSSDDTSDPVTPVGTCFTTKIEVPEATKVGETFAVTVTVENTSDIAIGVVNFLLKYDNTSVEPVLPGADCDGNVSGDWGNSDAMLAKSGDNGVVAFAMVTDPEAAIGKGETVVFTVEFKVLDTVSDQIAFEIAKDEELWACEVVEPTMTKLEGTASSAAITSVEKYIKGDVDGSGEVDSDDAVYLLMYTFFEDQYPLK